jgi:multiple sugar transport system ATP-binding protein
MATLELKNISKSYDKTSIIRSLDLSVADGEFIVFVGPSGCGKSTLLRIISGLDAPTGGDILIDGNLVNGVSAAHRGCAMVFQSYALYPHMTVYDNMAFGLENMKVPADVIAAKVNAAATLLRLDALLQRKPTQLSGGQRQRVAIGRSIVREPKLFLFDEPLSNLDAELRVSMRSEIRDLHARLKATMIYVTHDQVEAMTMADKIVVLRAGVIEQVGTPLELYNKPQNTFVAGFIGSPRMNFVPASAVPQSPAGTHTVGIRPEHAQLVASAGAGAIGALEVAVSQVEQLGSTSLLHGAVVHQGAEDTVFELVQNGQTQVQRGHKIHVTAPPEHLHYFDKDGLRL